MNSHTQIDTATCALEFAQAVDYKIRALPAVNSLVGQFMVLHQSVLKGLPSHGAHWVKRRHFATVKKHIEQGHTALGVFSGTKMVGQALLTFPDKEGEKNLAGYPIGQNALNAQNCLIVQTLGISRLHQGQGLTKILFAAIEQIAHTNGRAHLLAKTDCANTSSVTSFTNFGYVRGLETIVPGDPYKCVFMQKHLTV